MSRTVAFSLLRLLGIGGTKNTLFVHIYNILNEQACLRPKRRREKTNLSEAKKKGNKTNLSESRNGAYPLPVGSSPRDVGEGNPARLADDLRACDQHDNFLF